MANAQQKGLLIAILVFIYILALVVLTAASYATLGIVFIGLFPVLLHLILVSVRVSMGKELLFSWVTPILFPFIFYIVFLSNYFPIISQMDGQSLVLWQMLLSFVITLVAFGLLLIASPRSKRKHRTSPQTEQQVVAQVPQQANHHTQQHNQHHAHHAQSHTAQSHYQQQQQHTHQQQYTHEHHQQSQHAHHQEYQQQLQQQLVETEMYKQSANQFLAQNEQYQEYIRKLEQELRVTKQKLQVSRENISITLREIEAKAKAINFVVGRVYSDKNGGSTVIREKLHIDRDLYNAFSDLTAQYSQSDAQEVKNILQIIQNKLAIYELPEKQVFVLSGGAHNLIRDPSGETPILEVLASNDKDPIVDYYTGLREVCTKLLEFLSGEQSD